MDGEVRGAAVFFETFTSELALPPILRASSLFFCNSLGFTCLGVMVPNWLNLYGPGNEDPRGKDRPRASPAKTVPPTPPQLGRWLNTYPR